MPDLTEVERRMILNRIEEMLEQLDELQEQAQIWDAARAIARSSGLGVAAAAVAELRGFGAPGVE